ncbi:ABC transporter ATP-binding protein [Actinoplanes friuliensis]|uniref:ABC transporter-like protein n=1 Tax=Actinoplanes friuliensis DSM 7358 TaxID=1246995 RepID=U5W0L3_9ACTN|nr:ABC transporter ATP-binding protein [Actinoplanes friuliensis]AGZ41476.1 ABC transporter-like protein [Actinoplanes friuliensis DSM 7358]
MSELGHEPDDDGVIVLSGLTKLYEPTPRWMRMFARSHLTEPVKALDGIDLVVRPGEICAVVGPNGAGKTTLFRIIIGLTEASSGQGRVLGLDVARQSEQIRQVVGWMPAEDRSLLMRATVRENLQLHGRLQGMSRTELQERIPYVLQTVDLTAKTDVVIASLSAGMKARVRLARALLPGPRALILDEPTGAVDPIAAHDLLKLIMDLVKQEQLAVLISSHRLEEIEALQSKALLMDGGRIKYSGDLDSLRQKWDRPQLELVMADESATRLVADGLQAQGLDVVVDGFAVRCRLGDTLTIGAVLGRLGASAASIQHIREIPMPLRDLIAQIYRLDPAADGGTQ